MSLPLVMGPTGAQPQSPASLLAQLLALATAASPGLTANLPGAMIEDISSTNVAGLSLIDQATVETVNSVTPLGANAFLLIALGQIYGVAQGQDTNTSVLVTFTGSSPGAVIPTGFLVSDGTYQYAVQGPGVEIPTGLVSNPVLAIATQPGTWAVPEGTVTEFVSSAPTGVTSVTNPTAGTPSPGAQTEADYRQQVFTAGLAAAQGMERFLKTQLVNVPGVASRLISVQQQSGGGWMVLVGGGDPYDVAFAIFTGLFDISTLVGSTIAIAGITNANPGVVTTSISHGLTTGQSDVFIAGVVGMTGVNGGPYTATVVDDYSFSFGVNTTSSGAYGSGGSVTPDGRNVTVNLYDEPDTFTVPYVSPLSQTVGVTLTWNTTSTNFVSPVAVAQLGQAAIVEYVNNIPVGRPINLYAMESAFVAAVLPVFNNNAALISQMTWAITIDGTSVSPSGDTLLIYGDAQSFFVNTSANVTIQQAT